MLLYLLKELQVYTYLHNMGRTRQKNGSSKMTRKQQLKIARTHRILEKMTSTCETLDDHDDASDSDATIIIDSILSDNDYISNEEDTPNVSRSEMKLRTMKSDEIQGTPGGSYI